MKKIFECADCYVVTGGWKMIAVLKFCLISLGMLLGLSVSGKGKKAVKGLALLAFLATYIPLMADFINFARYFFKVQKITEE